jgi:transcriptional regulator with XRE-family HTH domain
LLIDEERWTYRKLEARTGISKSAIASRLKGETELMFGEVEIFADVLRRNPVELFAALLALPADAKKATRGGALSGLSLPDLDSNQEPAG